MSTKIVSCVPIIRIVAVGLSTLGDKYFKVVKSFAEVTTATSVGLEADSYTSQYRERHGVGRCCRMSMLIHSATANTLPLLLNRCCTSREPNLMNSKLLFATLMVLSCCISVQAAVTPGTWGTFTSTTAMGTVDGIAVNATTTSSSPIVGLSSNHLGRHWDAANPLGDSVLALTVANTNLGDTIDFSFSSALQSGTLLYIENFDSNSIATINAVGATNIAVLSNSMVNYVATDGSTGTLTSTNSGFDGNGDIAIILEGAVTSVSLDYTGGDGANGVFYAFAAPEPQAVPEPTSIMVMAGLFGLGGALTYYRRKKQQA